MHCVLYVRFSSMTYLRITSFWTSLNAPFCAKIKLLLLELVTKSVLIFMFCGQGHVPCPTSFKLYLRYSYVPC